MLRSVFPLNVNSIRRFSSTANNIPREFGKSLSTLFKQTKYDEVIQKIEASPYRNTAPMMKLLAESHKFLKIEHEDSYQRTIKQIEYMEKHKFPGFSISVEN